MLAHLRSTIKALRAAFWAAAPSAVPELPLQPPLTAPDQPLPDWIATDPLVHKYQALLGVLPWPAFPERPTDRACPGPLPHPRAPFVAAFLVQLHEQRPTLAALRRFLLDHPALAVWLGFQIVPDPAQPHGLDLARTVPTRRQLARVLRTLRPDQREWLLAATVHAHQQRLPAHERDELGLIVSGDTQAILAWVRENNPKQYVKEGRLDKDRQPAGDPDCKLGVKQRRNASPTDAPPTPTTEAQPASTLQVGSDIFWGYGAGVVATRLPDGTEIVLAAHTQPFNASDISYFHPLMAQAERTLGRRPLVGLFDAAFDAAYVYDYFARDGGCALVPLNPGKRGNDRQFDAEGRPLCAAGLGMPQLFTYQDRTSTLVVQARAKHGCPLRHPTQTADACPVADPHWEKGGCTTTLGASVGARLRLELDRDSDVYKTLFKQRTVAERINSQAEALGITHPKLRNGAAITNRNALIYALINLRALQRRPAPAPAVASA